MKLYERQIKPYIKPPCLPGLSGSPYPVDGYDYVSEKLEEKLRNEIVVSDPWSTLIFKERYVVKEFFGEWDPVPITADYIDKVMGRRVAKEILSIIEQIYFSEEYKQYRINYGSNGIRDLILNTIENKYLR